MNKFVTAIFLTSCWFITILNAGDPPETWKEHCFEHDQQLTRVYFNDHVAIYFDKNVNRGITWPNKYFTDAWKYVKKVYGNFGGDNRLYAIFHANSYSGGHPHTINDKNGDYRSVIDCGKSGGDNVWGAGDGNDLSIPTHEMAHIVEFSAHEFKNQPAFGIWGDSKWAEIFIYDVYKGVGKDKEAQQWFDSMQSTIDNFPKSGTQWFKNWFYPIYTMNEPTTTMGSYTLNKFFVLVSRDFPKNRGSMNMGEFINFWSGATGYNLKSFATSAFGWNSTYENQFEQAKKDFPNMPYDKFILFYDDINFKGKVSYQNLIGQCSNGIVDTGFNDQAKSVNTNGICVRVFDDKDCKGNSKVFSDDPRNECVHSDFGKCGFNNKASSFNNC